MARKGKMKISKVKRNNQTTNKMKKQGKLKLQRHHPKVQPKSNMQSLAHEPPSSDSDQSSDECTDMLDEHEQQDFLRRISVQPSFLASLSHTQDPNATQGRRQRGRKRAACPGDSGAESDAEGEPESRYRHEQTEEPAKRMRPLLPIKTRDGLQPRAEPCEDIESDGEAEQALVSDAKESTPSDESDATDSGVEVSLEDAERGSGEVTALQLMAARRENLRRERMRIGLLCSSVLESPEKNLKKLSPVLRLAEERARDGCAQMASVRKLAALSAFEVFSDLLPDYAIRHQDYSDVKLKKDTLALYKHEKELLDMYRRYLQRLERGAAPLRAKARAEGATDNSGVALACLRCLCGLLAARPNFNYAANIAASVVPLLDSRSVAARDLVTECCGRVLREDGRGEISLTVVRRVAQLVRRRGERVHPDALRCLLELRVQDGQLEADAALARRRHRDEKRKKRLINLSKNEKKRAKKLREVERELQETAAQESESTRRRHLTEATRALFHIYFRVLKGAPGSALLGAALEGVARFAHAINVEYYSDLVAALARLMRAEGCDSRGRLLCVRAVLAVLAGRGDALDVDPARFHDQLYTALAVHHAGNNHEDVKVVLECVGAVCARARRVSGTVLAALAKRLATLAAHAQHNGALAALAQLHRLAQQAASARALLDGGATPAIAADEAPGVSRFDPLLESAELCGARHAALHELVPLRRHYHKEVRIAAAALSRPPHTLQPHHLVKLSPTQIFEQYDGSQMGFKPSVPPPGPRTPAPAPFAAQQPWLQPSLHADCLATEASVPQTVDFTPLLRR